MVFNCFDVSSPTFYKKKLLGTCYMHKANSNVSLKLILLSKTYNLEQN